MATQAKNSMHKNWKTIVLSLMASFLLTGTAAFAAGKYTEVKGMIVSRTGETLIVKTSEGKVSVVLDDSTQTQDRKGLFGLEKQQLGNIVLIPGLKVDIDGLSGDQGQVLAKSITVDGDDLETAQMIQSGLHPTAEQVAANIQTLEAHDERIKTNQEGVAANQQDIATNKQQIAANKQDIATNKQQIAANIKDIQENTDRFSALSDYDVKREATLKFKVASSTLSGEDQEQLKTVGANRDELKGIHHRGDRVMPTPPAALR